MICCSCGKEIDINYGREYWNGIYCKKCADEMLSTPEDTKKYEKIIAGLQAENAALRERLKKSVELPVQLETPILKVWKNRVPEDDARMSFVDMWEITMANFKLEHYSLWGKFYFPNTEEGKKAAEARLAELKGEKQ